MKCKCLATIGLVVFGPPLMAAEAGIGNQNDSTVPAEELVLENIWQELLEWIGEDAE